MPTGILILFFLIISWCYATVDIEHLESKQVFKKLDEKYIWSLITVVLAIAFYVWAWFYLSKN